MCSFESVSYRLGAIISSAPAVEGDRSKPMSVEDIKHARKIGSKIQSNTAEYLEAIREAVLAASTSDKFGIFQNPPLAEFKKEKHDLELEITARFDPGLIIDFPKLVLRTDHWDIELRSCLTVCISGQRSKIWTRCVSRRRLSNTDVQSAQSLDKDTLKALHQCLKNLAKASNDVVKEKYQEDYSVVHGARLAFDYYGQINLFAVDCSEVSSLIESECNTLLNNNNLREINDEEIADALRVVSAVSLPPSGRDITADKSFKLSEESRFYAYRGKNGAGSIFVSTADDDNAYLSGVVNADGRESKTWAMGLSTTAELATFLGAVY